MIKNDRQYRITKAQAERFENALKALAATAANSSVHPKIQKAQTSALQSQLEELQADIQEYEELKSGKKTILKHQSIDDLPLALIKARIAAGMSQRDLADRVGLKEQQIQRYEATEYATASFDRIKNIANALDIQAQEEIFLPSLKPSLRDLFARMEEIGIDRDLFTKRLVPSRLRALIEDIPRLEAEKTIAIQAAAATARVFGWSVSEIFGKGSLKLNPAAVGLARFKTSPKAEQKRLSAYTVYAHTLALLVLDATKDLKQQEVPTDPLFVRNAILKKYGAVTFSNALDYVWSLGIPVLPLHDPGAFHGACWRTEGRNVIVLKQQHGSAARWLYDLLHELFHAGQEKGLDELSVIEEAPIDPERQDSDLEADANYFAEDVMLGGRSEQLEELCVREAEGSVERLKSIVPLVAQREGVETDALANHMAYRLSAQNINWWGAANNLQQLDPPPWEVATTILLAHLDLSLLNEFDREMLLRAVSAT